MNPDVYASAAQAEESHWWFRARRSILRAVLDKFFRGQPGPREILEVGCGNGGNLALLASYGNVYAVELDQGARSRAAARGLARVEAGNLPRALPFPGRRFDLIAALDVIEHVEEDGDSVRSLGERLKPGGLLLLTVPANPWLWGRLDEVSHHVRRYTRDGLLSLLRTNGFAVRHCSYFNTLLFPAAIAQIKLAQLARPRAYDPVRVPPWPLNGALESVFALERLLLPRFSLPFGLSLIAVAQAQAS